MANFGKLRKKLYEKGTAKRDLREAHQLVLIIGGFSSQQETLMNCDLLVSNLWRSDPLIIYFR